MNKPFWTLRHTLSGLGLLIIGLYPARGQQPEVLVLENDHFRLEIAENSGAITSCFCKDNNSEMIGEKRLASNFRIGLPLPDYQANYIDGMEQTPELVERQGETVRVKFSGLKSAIGNYPIELEYTISLKADYVSFRSRLRNNYKLPITEFWFPRLGGWDRFGNHRDAKLATPNYHTDSKHSIALFKDFPGGRGLGSEAAEWSLDYPGMVMPWWDIYDAASDVGLYLGYHDTIFRLSTWHTYLEPNASGDRDAWLPPEQAGGEPVGMVFSHVRYPFIQEGETLESGEFIVRVHAGDWHQGSMFYRDWFMQHWPFDKSDSWLRKEQAWFTSIIYQPEDKIIADYETYEKWTREAQKYGIHCYELIGWDKGGLERDYPVYQPEEKLGGREGFRRLLASIDANGGRCLVFNNYNILDQNTDWYKRELYKYKQQDGFGEQATWMAWGQSTLLARKRMNVRYHVRSSITPEIEKILADQFLDLVRDGAHGFQIDKVCVGSALDMNPLNTLKPDVALCEGLVDAIDRLYKQCKELNPDFNMASEFGHDRLLPYFDVGYRNAVRNQISTLRYVFPEWTSCQHVSAPRDFRGINSAVLTGSVICIEPDAYQGSLDQPIYHDLGEYIKEIIRIRTELAEIIFLGDYFDDQGARIEMVTQTGLNHKNTTPETGPAAPGAMPGVGTANAGEKKDPGSLIFKVHGNRETGQRAIVIVNDSPGPVSYLWSFTHKDVRTATLYGPFTEPLMVKAGEPVEIAGDGLHILVE
jgi:hypothetical protein